MKVCCLDWYILLIVKWLVEFINTNSIFIIYILLLIKKRLKLLI